MKYDIVTIHGDILYKNIDINVKERKTGENSILECHYGTLIPYSLNDNVIKYKMYLSDETVYVYLIRSTDNVIHTRKEQICDNNKSIDNKNAGKQLRDRRRKNMKSRTKKTKKTKKQC